MNKKNNRRPTRKEEEFRKELITIINFNHQCYSLIRGAKSKVELHNMYIYELDKRFNIISDYSMHNKMNHIEISNFSVFFDYNNINKSLEIASNYFHALSALSYNYQKQDSLAIKHISLKELLCGKTWNDYNIDQLESSINYFYGKERISDEKSFFEVYYKGSCLGCQEGYEIYDSIRKDIKEFIVSNDLQEYKTICKKWYGKTYNEDLVKLNPHFLQDRVEYDILSDLQVTLLFLKKANIYDKYIEKLRCAYTNNTPLIKLKNRYKELDITKYNFPNFIVNLDLNFNLSLDLLKDEIEHIYNFIHNSKDKDYNILFEKNIISKESSNVIKSTSNKSIALAIFKEKFESIEDINLELRVNIELFVLNLFLFDCQLLCLTQNEIDSILKNEFPDSLYEPAEFVSSKRDTYKNLLHTIVNQKYLTYTVGLNTDEILPQWCHL